MQREHNETVSKLNFMLCLVELIIELAQTRSSPLSQSMVAPCHSPRAASGFQLEGGPRATTTTFTSERQRTNEQLVLYVRALQLLTSSIRMAKEEFQAHRLQPSTAVKLCEYRLSFV